MELHVASRIDRQRTLDPGKQLFECFNAGDGGRQLLLDRRGRAGGEFAPADRRGRAAWKARFTRPLSLCIGSPV